MIQWIIDKLERLDDWLDARDDVKYNIRRAKTIESTAWDLRRYSAIHKIRTEHLEDMKEYHLKNGHEYIWYIDKYDEYLK